MLAVTVVVSLLCLSVRVSGDVSLHDPEETVYFVPPPSPSTLGGGGGLGPEQRGQVHRRDRPGEGEA